LTKNKGKKRKKKSTKESNWTQYLSTPFIVTYILSLSMDVRMLSQGTSINKGLATAFIAAKKKYFSCWFWFWLWCLWLFCLLFQGVQGFL
jgi:hypothetical protein